MILMLQTAANFVTNFAWYGFEKLKVIKFASLFGDPFPLCFIILKYEMALQRFLSTWHVTVEFAKC